MIETEDRGELVKKEKKKKVKVKVTYAKYTKMANLIALYLRSKEEAGLAGLTQKEIVAYYLEQCDIDEDDEDHVQQETKLCKRVIKRLLEKDNVLINVGDGADAAGEDGGLIMVHPNYVPS